ncbi:MAG TPA: alpha/beta fold hydrolase [Polyangiaceae bacterium]|nr:alpha/beta fold hydrolase [Polyangiaceae bacterium]
MSVFSCARAFSVLGLMTAMACAGCASADDRGDGSNASEDAVTQAKHNYPIVLVHGMGGFDKLQNLPINVVYFNGVKDDLATHGETQVFATIAPPYDTSEVRATYVATQIDQILAQTGAKKVNIIAHSQGGLDARILASPQGLGYGDRIASITTIATPHRGTKVADLVLRILDDAPGDVVENVTDAILSVLQESVYQLQTDPNLRAQINELSTKYMTGVFNPKYKDDSRVKYASYAGRTNLEVGWISCADGTYDNDVFRVDAVPALLFPTAVYLQGLTDTTNDGLVTVSSAHWGEFMQCVPADHLGEVGQLLKSGSDPLSGFDHLAFFRTIVSRLRNAGY